MGEFFFNAAAQGRTTGVRSSPRLWRRASWTGAPSGQSPERGGQDGRGTGGGLDWWGPGGELEGDWKRRGKEGTGVNTGVVS